MRCSRPALRGLAHRGGSGHGGADRVDRVPDSDRRPRRAGAASPRGAAARRADLVGVRGHAGRSRAADLGGAPAGPLLHLERRGAAGAAAGAGRALPADPPSELHRRPRDLRSELRAAAKLDRRRARRRGAPARVPPPHRLRRSPARRHLFGVPGLLRPHRRALPAALPRAPMISEPIVTLTDYGLTAECAVLAWLMSRRAGGPAREWFTLFFLSLGAGALTGGTV